MRASSSQTHTPEPQTVGRLLTHSYACVAPCLCVCCTRVRVRSECAVRGLRRLWSQGRPRPSRPTTAIDGTLLSLPLPLLHRPTNSTSPGLSSSLRASAKWGTVRCWCWESTAYQRGLDLTHSTWWLNWYPTATNSPVCASAVGVRRWRAWCRRRPSWNGQLTAVKAAIAYSSSSTRKPPPPPPLFCLFNLSCWSSAPLLNYLR